MTEGYFKLQRRFFTHWLWAEKRSLSKAEAWLDLLQIAAFAPTKRFIRDKLLTIEEGEMIASLRYLAKRWEWNKDKVGAFLKILEDEKMIRRESRQSETVIIVCRYKDYSRMIDSTSDTPNNKSQTVSRQRPDKVEERKEIEEEKRARLATFEEVKAFAKSAPMGISLECAEGFFDEMETIGWIHKGQPIADWRARFRRFATNWHQNEQGRKFR